MPTFGDILDIDLTTDASQRRPFDGAAVGFVLGGRGTGVLELWGRTTPDTDADRLPVRFTERSLDSIGREKAVVDVCDLRHELYGLMGWDEDGVPSLQTLSGLGLEEIAR